MNDFSSVLSRLESLLDRIEPMIPSIPKTVDFKSSSAFRWIKPKQHFKGYLQAISNPASLSFDTLLGIDDKIIVLKNNTQQFISGYPANNVLLTGSRGTGKSSLIKATLSEFKDQGLKMIEIDRDDLNDLSELLIILQNEPYYFIIYCDDLSFESSDVSYKSLKALLDGSLMEPPKNILFYATSNRRHLIPEYMSENQSTTMGKNGEIHPNEAIEEKISLSERFGLWLTFYAYSQEEYLNIVQHWITIFEPSIKFDQKITFDALQYALLRGSRSGRVAQQFARQFVGEHHLKNTLTQS